MAWRSKKDGRRYKIRYKSNSRSNDKPIITDKDLKKQEQSHLRDELKREKEVLRKMQERANKIKKYELRQAKYRAIGQAISEVKKNQRILNALYTNRISPQKVDEIRHGSRDLGGSEFRIIPGFH